MPIKLAGWTLAHGRLERPELRNGLQFLDSLNSFLEEFRVRVSLCRFIAYGFQSDRILLQMLGRSIEEMFQLESMSVGTAGCLL